MSSKFFLVNPFPQVLRELNVRGWTQNTPINDQGEVCLAGSFLFAFDKLYPRFSTRSDGPSKDDVYQFIAEIIVEDYPDYYPWLEDPRNLVARWNDDDHRIFPEVEALLFKAASRWETEWSKEWLIK